MEVQNLLVCLVFQLCNFIFESFHLRLEFLPLVADPVDGNLTCLDIVFRFIRFIDVTLELFALPLLVAKVPYLRGQLVDSGLYIIVLPEFTLTDLLESTNRRLDLVWSLTPTNSASHRLIGQQFLGDVSGVLLQSA